MKKKIKDCSKKELFNAIFNDGQTSIGDDNCKFCRFHNANNCLISCKEKYETCIDYDEIIEIVGEEEIEVEDNEFI